MKYKVLMYGHIFVDMDMLFKGIYGQSEPMLFNHNMTLEKLISNTKDNFKFFNIREGEYFNNLEQCKMVDITLTINS